MHSSSLSHVTWIDSNSVSKSPLFHLNFHENRVYHPHFCILCDLLNPPENQPLNCAWSILSIQYSASPNISKLPQQRNPKSQANSSEVSSTEVSLYCYNVHYSTNVKRQQMLARINNMWNPKIVDENVNQYSCYKTLWGFLK
jgi:hypothetical protein